METDTLRLLKEIIRTPDDDLLRLMYADALDEQAGWETQGAKFIRKQIEYERLANMDPKDFYVADLDRMKELKEECVALYRQALRIGAVTDNMTYRRGFCESWEGPQDEFDLERGKLLWHPEHTTDRECPPTAHPVQRVGITGNVREGTGKKPAVLKDYQKTYPWIDFGLKKQVTVQTASGVRATMGAGATIRAGQAVYAGPDGKVYPISSDEDPVTIQNPIGFAMTGTDE